MDASADETVLERFKDVSLQVQDCFRATSNVNDIVGLMMMRLEAIVTPTPELKIRAISAQPMRLLAEAAVASARQMNSAIRETSSQVASLAAVLESGYIQCPKCQGVGEIEEDAIQRDEESVGAYTVYRTCPNCSGNKVIRISSDLRENCQQAIRGLGLLRTATET